MESNIIKIYRNENHIDDLDLVNIDAILGVNEDGHDYNVIVVDNTSKSYHCGSSQEIEIDTLIEHLETSKKRHDVNYVEILNDPDHHGFIFNFLEMRKATTDETSEWVRENKLKDQERLKEEIKRKESELESLKSLVK